MMVLKIGSCEPRSQPEPAEVLRRGLRKGRPAKAPLFLAWLPLNKSPTIVNKGLAGEIIREYKPRLSGIQKRWNVGY